MKAIFRRELRFYYHYFTGYAFAAVLLPFAGIYTMAICLQSGYSNFEYVLGNIGFIFLLIVPILTMRTFAEEKSRKLTSCCIPCLPVCCGS